MLDIRVRVLSRFLLSALTGAALASCSVPKEAGPTRPVIGNAGAGAIWITRAGCGSCHQIPGIMHARGLVGPPLEHFGKRTMVAGYLPNTPANLVHWIQHPQQVLPGNAMPEGGLTTEQSRDVAAYLYTLK